MRHGALVLMILAGTTAAYADETTNITFAADIQITPETVPDAQNRLVDGNIGSAVTFEVGSEGDGTFTFSFTGPRAVEGVRFYQTSEIYHSTAYVIEADTAGEGEFATVLADADDFPIKEWVEHDWEPVAVHALRFRSLAGVSEGRRARPMLSQFEILGVMDPDDLRLASERGIPIFRLPAVRDISRETDLVVAGRPPALLAPEDDAYQPAVQALLAGLAVAGVEAEVVSDIEAADPAARTVICLGNMLSNPVIERLYWNRYTHLDALVPGPGQYLLHTVYDPYPDNGGNNVIVIGCSEPEGALPGVERLLDALEGQTLPWVMASGPVPTVSEDVEQQVAGEEPDPTFVDLASNVILYLETGSDAYAQKAVRNMEIMAELYAPGGDRYVPIGSSTHRKMPWPEETRSWEIMCAWDAFEYYPGISDQLRLDFSNAMLQYTRDLVSHVSGYGRIGQNDLVAWNHTTFPLLGVHFGARYFDRYYGLADMPEKLEKARASLMAQARSWKPEEDADSYLTISTEHSRIYSLAENEMHYFESSLMRTYADYIVTICDNQGRGSGFGDSGLSDAPRLPLKVLPLALWWTGDGGYQWLLDNYTGGNWRNPYERNIEPVRPDRLAGVNVFMTDPQVYQYIQTYPTYNEPFEKTDVPLEESFDKLSFRESWDPDGQYMLLDGISRLKHLHYDGNSIITFVEAGDRWLLDHDYLTRNTTEHTMLSVLRDGRCDQLLPSLSGISAWADLPGFGYTDTYTRDYNGIDWQRQILWRRGEWFVIADTVTAREAGDYDLDLTWKTIDEDGHQRITGASDFVAERGVAPGVTTDCAVIDDEQASGGRALLMDRETSRVVFGADLPAGDYQLAIVAYGVDSSSDSLWVEVGAQMPIALHMPKGSYGVSGGDHTLSTPSPMVTLEGDAPHRITVTLRERPPMRIDRFIFEHADGRTHVYQAEDLPPPPEDTVDTVRGLNIKPATDLQAWVTNHERAGMSVPISILHQRQSTRLESGDTARFASLMYVSRPGKTRELAPVQIAPNLLAVQGSDPALAMLGDVEAAQVRAELRAGLLTPDGFMLSGLTELELPGLALVASAPVDLELGLASGMATAGTPEGGAGLTVEVAGKARTLTLDAGDAQIELPGLAEAAGDLADFVRRAVADAEPAEAAGIEAQATEEADEPLWSALGESGDRIHRVRTADLRDGLGDRLFVARGRSLHCLDTDGSVLWSFDTGGIVRDMAFGDLRDTPGDEVVAGSADAHLYVLSAQGELLASHETRGMPWARSFGDRAYGVFGVLVGDITGDDRPEILVTMQNFDLQALTVDFELLWKYDHALHGSMDLSFEDTDGDGAADTIFVANKYGSSVACDFEGNVRYRRYTSIGDVAYTVADITGDGAVDVVTGSSTGDMVATAFPDQSETLWRFDNYGYPATRLEAADLTGDGASEVILASGTGYVHVVRGAGEGEEPEVLWQERVGLSVNDVIVVDEDAAATVIAADEAGVVALFDAQGQSSGLLRTASPPRLLTTVGGGEGRILAVGLADGTVAAYPLR